MSLTKNNNDKKLLVLILSCISFVSMLFMSMRYFVACVGIDTDYYRYGIHRLIMPDVYSCLLWLFEFVPVAFVIFYLYFIYKNGKKAETLFPFVWASNVLYFCLTMFEPSIFGFGYILFEEITVCLILPLIIVICSVIIAFVNTNKEIKLILALVQMLSHVSFIVILGVFSALNSYILNNWEMYMLLFGLFGITIYYVVMMEIGLETWKNNNKMNITRELKMLNKLYERGSITLDEYKVRRMEILTKI